MIEQLKKHVEEAEKYEFTEMAIPTNTVRYLIGEVERLQEGHVVWVKMYTELKCEHDKVSKELFDHQLEVVEYMRKTERQVEELWKALETVKKLLITQSSVNWSYQALKIVNQALERSNP